MTSGKDNSHELLTVIIPTRDRAETLKYALKTITSQKDPNIEIIVSDNLSGPEVKQVADDIDDKRLRYIRTSERMGMSEHWDFALSHAKPGWVTIVGDDDGLLPGSVEKFFRLTKQNPHVKAITTANCWFRWPDNSGKNQKLMWIGGKGYEVRDSKKFLKRCMNGDFVHLPTIYTGGFVHTDVINEIKTKSDRNAFFHSTIPDLYSGMAICLVADKYIYSYEPLGLAGTSNKSNGVLLKNKTKEELKKTDFFKENSQSFDPSLAGGYTDSMPIIMYDAYLQSKHLRDEDFLNLEIEDQLVIAAAQISSKKKKQLDEYLREVCELNNIDFEKVKRRAKCKRFTYRIGKLFRKFMKKIPGNNKLNQRVINNSSAKNIYEAAECLNKMLG